LKYPKSVHIAQVKQRGLNGFKMNVTQLEYPCLGVSIFEVVILKCLAWTVKHNTGIKEEQTKLHYMK